MEPLHQLFSNTLFYKRTWIRKNIPSAAHWLRGWIFSIQLKPRYEVSRTDTPELEIMYPPDERAEVAAAESQSPLQARLILVRLGFYYIQSIDLFNLQWFTHCMMWNDVQWNLTHRVTERINIFVVYLYIWFRHTAWTPAWSGLRCRGSWFFSFSVGSWTTLFLSPCIWHYIFLSASQLLVLLGNWCFLLSIKKCQWEKGYSTQGQKFSWTHLQTFTNILIRYFVNSLSLTFSKDLICVVWEGFMVPVRWLSWLCGSWSYVRVRRLKKKMTIVEDHTSSEGQNLLIAWWWLMVTDAHLMEIKARSTMFLKNNPITSMSFCPCWGLGLGLCFPQRRRDQAPPRTWSTNNCYRLFGHLGLGLHSKSSHRDWDSCATTWCHG